MRLLLTLVFCSLFAAACGDDDFSKGGLDLSVDDAGDEDMGHDLSAPDLSAVVDTDSGTD